MEKMVNSLVNFSRLIKGVPPTLSPTLDGFETTQYTRESPKSAADNFRILINVSVFEPPEIEIYVLEKKFVEIRAKHDKRQNFEGLWMTRNCTCTYELPPEVCGKELHAEWSEDNYLLIQVTSSKCDEDGEKVRLIPEHVQQVLKPVVEVGVLKEMIQDFRDQACEVIRYIRFHTQSTKMVQEGAGSNIKQQNETSEDDSSSSDSDESITTDK